jgi:hypothetical protein
VSRPECPPGPFAGPLVWSCPRSLQRRIHTVLSSVRVTHDCCVRCSHRNNQTLDTERGVAKTDTVVLFKADGAVGLDKRVDGSIQDFGSEQSTENCSQRDTAVGHCFEITERTSDTAY